MQVSEGVPLASVPVYPGPNTLASSGLSVHTDQPALQQLECKPHDSPTAGMEGLGNSSQQQSPSLQAVSNSSRALQTAEPTGNSQARSANFHLSQRGNEGSNAASPMAGKDLPPGFATAQPAQANLPQPAPAVAQPQVQAPPTEDLPPGFAKGTQGITRTVVKQQPQPQPQQLLETAQARAQPPAGNAKNSKPVAQKQQAKPARSQTGIPSSAASAAPDDLPPGFVLPSRSANVIVAPRLQPQRAASALANGVAPALVVANKGRKQTASPVAAAEPPRTKSQQLGQPNPPRYDSTAGSIKGVPQPSSLSAAARPIRNQPGAHSQDDLKSGAAAQAKPPNALATSSPSQQDLPPGFSGSAMPSTSAAVPSRSGTASSNGKGPTAAAVSGQRRQAATAPQQAGNSPAATQQPHTARSDGLPLANTSAPQRHSSQPENLATRGRATGSVGPSTRPASQATSSNKQSNKPRQKPAASAQAAPVSSAGQAVNDNLPPGFAGVASQQQSPAATVLTAPLAAVTAAAAAAPIRIAQVADQAKASLKGLLGFKQPATPGSAPNSPNASAAEHDRPPGYNERPCGLNGRPVGYGEAGAKPIPQAFAAGDVDRPPGFLAGPQQAAGPGRKGQLQKQLQQVSLAHAVRCGILSELDIRGCHCVVSSPAGAGGCCSSC